MRPSSTLLLFLSLPLLALSADSSSEEPAPVKTIKCFACNNFPFERACKEDDTCKGQSCFVVYDNAKQYYFHGCADEPVAINSCYTSGQRTLCACGTKRCNSEGAGFKPSRIPPLHSIQLDNFFETIPTGSQPPQPAVKSTEQPAEPQPSSAAPEPPAPSVDPVPAASSEAPPSETSTNKPKPKAASTAFFSFLFPALVALFLLSWSS